MGILLRSSNPYVWLHDFWENTEALRHRGNLKNSEFSVSLCLCVLFFLPQNTFSYLKKIIIRIPVGRKCSVSFLRVYSETLKYHQTTRVNNNIKGVNIMKAITIIASILLASFTSLAQNNQTVALASDTTAQIESVTLGMHVASNVDGDKEMSFYRSIEQHSEELRVARKEYKAQLETAISEEEISRIVSIIDNIDEMLRTNDRILQGKATIKSIN